MKRMGKSLDEIVGPIPAELTKEVDLSFEISDRIFALMNERGLSKRQFADAIGRRPSEITKWLSGQHNFTIATLAKLSAFFNEPIISVCSGGLVAPV
jgi:predicted transcriptional regulator